MKKFLLLLSALALFTSCRMDDVFTISGLQCFVSVIDGKLTGDDGGVGNFTESQVPTSDWKIEGARWFINYDVLNRNYDLRLNSVERCQVVAPQALEAGAEVTPGGPVVRGENSLNAKFFSFRLFVFHKKGSAHVTTAQMFYTLNPESNHVDVRLVADDNGENPLHENTADLEQRWEAFSFPMEGLLDASKKYTVSVTYDGLEKGTSGDYVLVQRTE